MTQLTSRVSIVSLAAVFLLAASCAKNEPTSSAPTPTAPEPEPEPEPEPAAEPEPEPAAAAAADPLRAAIDDPDRPDEDRKRDSARKPYEVLSFYGIAPGMKVADLITGTGYYSAIIGRVVGPDGALYAHNNKNVATRMAEPGLTQRLSHPDLAHATKLVSELEDLQLPAGELDAVLMFLAYHDTYWFKVDRAKFNAEVFAALKPGGIYGIIDHHAAKGAGDTVTKSLHRVERQLVIDDILAAGFELEAESDMLANPQDDRTLNVFSPLIRGKTDRFVLKFRKPR